MALVAAALVFVTAFTLVVGLWWVAEARRRLRARLSLSTRGAPTREAGALRQAARRLRTAGNALLARTPVHGRLTLLTEQAGYRNAVAEWLAVIVACAAGGGVVGWLRGGGLLGFAAAALGGAVPVGCLGVRRHQRLDRFAQQLPDALGMMTRALRAGSALTGAIQLVGDEMPEPTGGEFTRAAEEIRLGFDPGEALVRLRLRVPTDDMRFFCTAIAIQRGAGGNLAEILDRLSEVIRERFKLLSYARVLSAQHRWSAICVGVSPVVFAALLQLTSPAYFDPLLTSPYGPRLIEAGVALETIGFVMIWRIAKIRV